MSVTLSDFLRARLDEDEARARDLRRQSQVLRLALQGREFIGKHLPGWHMPTEAAGMCDRVLADSSAKRAVLREYDNRQCPVSDAVMTDVIRALVQPYRDHPDYLPEWTQPGTEAERSA